MDIPRAHVALLAEGVDRNRWCKARFTLTETSPSSRRAWIEITKSTVSVEGANGSPSSRRAWIEIGLTLIKLSLFFVALLAEGVGG